MGTKTLATSNLKVGRIIHIDFSNKLSSGNGQSSTLRVKLGSTEIVTNTQTLPNGLNGNLFIGCIDLVVIAEGINGLVRATGKSDVVNNQLNVLTRALESVGDISIDLSQPLDVDFTYSYVEAEPYIVHISRKTTIIIK